MAIKEHDRKNFNTLLRAAKAGRLALMECQDAVTGEYRAVICAVGKDGEDFTMTPFGHLSTADNPFEVYTPPAA